jgi:hypothetical protein
MNNFDWGKLIENVDGDQHHWRIPAEDDDGESGAIEGWWNRGPGKRIDGRLVQPEEFVLRQVNDDENADVIILTPGQVYDMIALLTRAVERA